MGAPTGPGRPHTPDELKLLAGAAVHDARNPLNAMALHLELLSGAMGQNGVDPRHSKSVAALERELRRVDQILGSYLELISDDASEPRPADADRLIDRAVDSLAAMLQARQVTLTQARAPASPEVLSTEPETVVALVSALQWSVDRSPAGGAVALRTRLDTDLASVVVELWQPAGTLVAADVVQLFRLASPHGGHGALCVAKQALSSIGGMASAERVGDELVLRFGLPLA